MNPDKKVYLQVLYFFPDTRPHAPSSTMGTPFYIDELAGGVFSDGLDSGRGLADEILTTARGTRITVPTGWLWRELLRVESTPMTLRTEPPAVKPSTVLPFVIPGGPRAGGGHAAPPDTGSASAATPPHSETP